MNVTYTVLLPHSGVVCVPDGADGDDIRGAIEGDIDRYVTVRTWNGIGADADYTVDS